MPDAATIRATVETYTRCHSAGDIDGIIACFAPGAIAEDPVGSGRHEGIDALRAFFEGTHQMAESLELNLTGPIRVAGNRAAFPMTVTTHIGDMTMELDIIDTMLFDDDGKVLEMFAYWSFDDARTL